MDKRSFLEGKNCVFQAGKLKNDQTQQGRWFDRILDHVPAEIPPASWSRIRGAPGQLGTVSKFSSKTVRK